MTRALFVCEYVDRICRSWPRAHSSHSLNFHELKVPQLYTHSQLTYFTLWTEEGHMYITILLTINHPTPLTLIHLSSNFRDNPFIINGLEKIRLYEYGYSGPWMIVGWLGKVYINNNFRSSKCIRITWYKKPWGSVLHRDSGLSYQIVD